jgi:hypothetical protein
MAMAPCETILALAAALLKAPPVFPAASTSHIDT